MEKIQMKQLMSKSVLGKLVGLKKIAFWLHEACTYCLAFYEIPLHFIGSVQSIFFCAILWSVIMFSLSILTLQVLQIFPNQKTLQASASCLVYKQPPKFVILLCEHLILNSNVRLNNPMFCSHNCIGRGRFDYENGRTISLCC